MHQLGLHWQLSAVEAALAALTRERHKPTTPLVDRLPLQFKLFFENQREAKNHFSKIRTRVQSSIRKKSNDSIERNEVFRSVPFNDIIIEKTQPNLTIYNYFSTRHYIGLQYNDTRLRTQVCEALGPSN